MTAALAARGPDGDGFHLAPGVGLGHRRLAIIDLEGGRQPLYAAEWYREPTSRELAFYLPKRMPEGGGWGVIACKTAPRHRVSDCVVLGNGPAGSGLGRAVLNASWQFLVRAPRRGGKELVGEWVRIRINYTPE